MVGRDTGHIQNLEAGSGRYDKVGPEEGVESVGIIRGGTRQMKLNGGLRLREERRKGVERLEVGLSSPAEGEGRRRGRDLWSGLGLAKGTAGTRV